MKEQLASAMTSIVQVMLPVLLGLLGWVGVKVHAWLTTNVKNEKLRGILDRLYEAAATVVKEVEQAVVSKLDPNVSPAQNAETARQAALTSLKTHLGPTGLAELKAILGLEDVPLEQLLLSYIEAAVKTMNTMKYDANPTLSSERKCSRR